MSICKLSRRVKEKNSPYKGEFKSEICISNFKDNSKKIVAACCFKKQNLNKYYYTTPKSNKEKLKYTVYEKENY